MTNKKPIDPRQPSYWDNLNQPTQSPEIETNVFIPLELGVDELEDSESTGNSSLYIPARWEAALEVAENKNVLPVLLRQIRRVEALEYLEYLITLSRDEGYVWVVYGDSGSGKSTFFHTLEYQTTNHVRKHIINGDEVNLSSQRAFSKYLTQIIREHKATFGESTPLVIVLEERESSMSTEERSSIAQVLKNVLRPPGPGKGVIFVLPVVDSNQGTLFMKQVQATGVSIPLGHNALYTFHGPPYTEHVDIFINLFVTLNDKDISDIGLQRSDLQVHVSSQQTIGQYIRTIREEIVKTNIRASTIVKRHNYKKFTVIVCFINPLPAYRTEPIVKAMTMDAFGKLRTGEILRVTQSQRAKRWENNQQALSNIVSALDIRIVEITPQIISKLVYAYEETSSQPSSLREPILRVVQGELIEAGIDYNAPKALRQNLRQQLQASNLFRIIANTKTKSYSTPRYSKQSTSRKEKEQAEIAITRSVCEASHSRQHELHTMFAQALNDLLKNSEAISGVADFKAVYPEAGLTVTQSDGNQKKVVQPDIAIEMQDNLFLLELCWRSEEHFTYADIATYVLRKIQESYLNLPLIQDLTKVTNI